jgi:hypothetical protein
MSIQMKSLEICRIGDARDPLDLSPDRVVLRRLRVGVNLEVFGQGLNSFAECGEERAVTKGGRHQDARQQYELCAGNDLASL